MRHLKLLGLALLATFALGATAASMASAIEPGVLYLVGEKAPVSFTVANQAIESKLKLLNAKLTTITCTGVSGAGSLTDEPSSKHSTLGTLGIDYTGCKSEGNKCSSVNTAGEKDAGETLLLSKEDADIHTVAILNGSTLVPGLLVGLLELENKLDPTFICGVLKVKALGAVFLEVKGTSLATEETKAVEVIPTTLTCDSADELCIKALASWDSTVGGVLCPMSATIGTAAEEVCLSYTQNKPAVTSLEKKVLFDF